MEHTTREKRKREGSQEKEKEELKRSKVTEPCGTNSSIQEGCPSSGETPSNVGARGVSSEEAGAHDSRAARQGGGNKVENFETTVESNEKEEQEEVDRRDDCSVNETWGKSADSVKDKLEYEEKSDVRKEDFAKVPSEDDDEALEEAKGVNRSFKRPRSPASPSSPDGSASERAACSPNSEEMLRCGKKLKIDEVEEENIQPGTSPTEKEDSEREQTKENENIENIPCSRNPKSSLNDPAFSPDNSDVKELNVVEFCRLTSFDQASVLNGNDHILEQSLLKESCCDDPVFSGTRDFAENNLSNNSFPVERDVFAGVEQEAAQEFPPRRRRKKHIINALQKLLEFYLSRGNVTKDKFVQQNMSPDGYVDLTVFLSFNKVKCLTDELKLLKYAAKNSALLELSYDETRVKLKLGYPDKENEEECTVYVDYLPRTATREWVCHYFTQFGEVEFVSLPLFKDSKRSRGFAFVEFRVPAFAQLAVDSHEGIHTIGNCGQGFSHMSSSERSTSAQVCSSKYELLSAVPDSSSQGDDENPSRVEEEHVSTEETLTDSIITTTTTTTTATATTAGSEAESTNGAAENLLLKNNNESRNIDDESQNENRRASRPRGAQPTNPQLLFSFEEEQNLALPKRICKNSRLKRCIEKRKLVGPGLVDQFLVIPKRVWCERRQVYFSEQKKRLGMCKTIMATERLQQEALKIEFDGPRPQKQMPVKVPGVVVKVTLEQPIVDKASLIAGVKSMGGAGVQFVDCEQGEKIFHVRFNSREGASRFRHTSAWKSKSTIIEGQEEDEFWSKVQSSWTARITNPRIRKKMRGKDKITNRWRKRRETLEGTCNDVIPDPNADQE